MPVLFFLVLAVGLHLGLILENRREKRLKKPKPLTGGLTLLLCISDCIGIGLMVLGLVLFEARWWLTLCWILAGGLAAWLLIALLYQWFNRKRFLLWLALALPAAACIGGTLGWSAHLDAITLREQFNYRTYRPFTEGSLVQKLDEPAALRFSAEDTLPRMDGATALYPVYAAFCQAVYPPERAETDDDFFYHTIDCSTTSSAYRGIVDGDCDIIFVASPSKEQEDYAAARGVKLVYTPIGREAFVFFTHPDNPIRGLTLEEIRGIYSGQIRQWDQLGVPKLGEILAYQREEGSGSQTALRRFVMGDTPLMPAEKEQVMDGMGDMVEQVSAYRNHRNALGYSFRFYCTGLMKGFDVKLLEVEGRAPTEENIENGTYPLASSFYAVTRSDADANTLALVDWICGEQGQALVRKSGYTPNGASPQN